MDELNASSSKLAAKYPDIVSEFELGKSTEGRPIMGLKIGSGSQNSIMFGCPHPNEPIGTMLLEHFTRSLAENEELRREIDYSFYIVKVWDVDGYVRNEGWIKGPYTLYNYSRNFYRPVSYKQVDWTFPIDYKNYHFHDTMPETKAMQNLIDEVKPTFTYALHNAGFGGTYFYVSEDYPDLYPSLYDATFRMGIPLHLGEPEDPALKVLAPAVLLAEGIAAGYDYLEKFGEEHPEKVIKSGTCSDDYSKERYGTFTFLTELPYFYDPRIADQSPSEKLRGDAMVEGLEWIKNSNAEIMRVFEKTKPHMAEDNLYMLAILGDNVCEDGMDAQIKMAKEDPAFRVKATKAQEFDSLWCTKFYRLLALGMLIRAHEEELEKEQSIEAREALEWGKEEAERMHSELEEFLEENLNYSVIPIKTLVNIQLECGIKTALYIHEINSKTK
ncbi:MAG: zinc carboxypeptidase [Clostridiales bacterium]|nr:zinc carboxypeptidase [Clostridiales bacterium]